MLCCVSFEQHHSLAASKKQQLQGVLFVAHTLQVAPSSHQAGQLKSAIDDAIVKEGLIGVGVGTGLVTVAAIAIGLLMSGRKR